MLLVGIQNGSLQRSKMTNALTFDPAILPLGMYLTVLNGIQIESFIITLSLRAEDWEQSMVISTELVQETGVSSQWSIRQQF